ncbi:MAG: hypothetical protein A4E54_01419 [Pelotomaculum sp. PtaB.Bin117]|nr:MAG: hypothetical protein A4E54_01419 [Pelotomaculum sp. PtaB.Bin117]OPY58998.1 MAG: hypothetical protein A4E56_03308 [Pelotomaculum sp. PtaU1.Bin065]
MQLEARLAELKDISFENLTQAEVKELGQLRRERRAILSDPDPEVICGARKHDGSPCQNPAERGSACAGCTGELRGVGRNRGSNMR